MAQPQDFGHCFNFNEIFHEEIRVINQRRQSGAIQLADAGPEQDEDGGFVPIPIYGGPFPDPMRRARV